MKTIYALFAGLLITSALFAQNTDSTATAKQDTSYWKKAFKGSLSINQAAFSDNWNGGGINSIGMSSLINYKANYAKDKQIWNNEIDLFFGFMNNEGQGYRKNNDRIFIDTKYGYKIAKKWNISAAASFLTQFSEGYKYEKDAAGVEQSFKISDFLAPAYLTTAFGVEYTPTDYMSLRLSPFAPRLTIVNDTSIYNNVPENYGVEIGETTRMEWMAFQLVANFDKNLSETVNLKWRYMMYANYEQLTIDQLDHRFDLTFSAKIAKYFDVNFTGIMIYDKDQSARAQFSQGFGIGFVYTYKNFKEE